MIFETINLNLQGGPDQGALAVSMSVSSLRRTSFLKEIGIMKCDELKDCSLSSSRVLLCDMQNYTASSLGRTAMALYCFSICL